MFKKIKNTIHDLLLMYCMEFKLVKQDAGIILFFLFLLLRILSFIRLYTIQSL